MLCKVWLDGKEWEGVKTRLPRGYRWEVQLATRRSRMIGVYVNRDLDKKLDIVREKVENDKGKLKTIVGGDFNARI